MDRLTADLDWLPTPVDLCQSCGCPSQSASTDPASNPCWPPEVHRPPEEGLQVTRITKAGVTPKAITGATLARVTVAGLDLTAPIPPEAGVWMVVVSSRSKT